MEREVIEGRGEWRERGFKREGSGGSEPRREQSRE